MKLTYTVMLFAAIEVLYILFCPSYPAMQHTKYVAFLRVVFYLNHYGILFFISRELWLKVKNRAEKAATLGLCFYAVGKFIFYMLLINKDTPTFINQLNSKAVDLGFSALLWFIAFSVYYYKFKIYKLLR